MNTKIEIKDNPDYNLTEIDFEKPMVVRERISIEDGGYAYYLIVMNYYDWNQIIVFPLNGKDDSLEEHYTIDDVLIHLNHHHWIPVNSRIIIGDDKNEN